MVLTNQRATFSMIWPIRRATFSMVWPIRGLHSAWFEQSEGYIQHGLTNQRATFSMHSAKFDLSRVCTFTVIVSVQRVLFKHSFIAIQKALFTSKWVYLQVQRSSGWTLIGWISWCWEGMDRWRETPSPLSRDRGLDRVLGIAARGWGEEEEEREGGKERRKGWRRNWTRKGREEKEGEQDLTCKYVICSCKQLCSMQLPFEVYAVQLSITFHLRIQSQILPRGYMPRWLAMLRSQ